ncbi:MAG: YceI family protein, partial [Dokdonella sp.]
ARVDARIDTNAVSMRRNGVEGWVKSEEFFDVENFPEIRFQSDSFPLSRLDTGGDLPGSLTLRGIRRPVLFALKPATCGRPALDCAVEANGTVRRSEFGMRTRRATLSDKVDLSLSIRMSDDTARSAHP